MVTKFPDIGKQVIKRVPNSRTHSEYVIIVWGWEFFFVFFLLLLPIILEALAWNIMPDSPGIQLAVELGGGRHVPDTGKLSMSSGKRI